MNFIAASGLDIITSRQKYNCPNGSDNKYNQISLFCYKNFVQGMVEPCRALRLCESLLDIPYIYWLVFLIRKPYRMND